MRYTVVIVLETDLEPERLRDELISGLEFDREGTVLLLVVRTEASEEVAAFTRDATGRTTREVNGP